MQTAKENLPEVNGEQEDGMIPQITCPLLISLYNKYVGGVDKND